MSVAVVLAGGCPAEEPPGDSGTADSGTADSGAADTGPETSSTTESPTGPGETDADRTSSGGASVPWSDVACGMATCSGTEVCVQPASYCGGPCVDNYTDLITPPPTCEPFLDSCDPADPGACLAEEHCSSDLWSLVEDEGLLRCEGGPDDCYCG